MSKSTRNARVLLAALLAAGPLLASGCAGIAPRDDSKLSSVIKKPEWLKAPWSKSDAKPPKPYPNPVKVASTWTPDVLVQSGKTPTRGFGGRLFFFDEKTKPVPVEGTLTVHGFEIDSQGRETQIKPFKFTPDQFTQHFSESDFGASYSVWIPWDAVGGEEKRVSLVPTFRTTDGKIVQGSPTTIILPGRKTQTNPSVATSHLSPQYQGHRDAVAHHPTRPSGLVTTTIRRYSTSPDGESTLPSPSLRQRARNIIASHGSAASDGNTRFVDVPAAKPSLAKSETPSETSNVMPASAVISDRDENQVRPAGPEISTPRRIGAMHPQR